MAAVLVIVWRLFAAVSVAAVVYVFSRLSLPAIFSDLAFTWPADFVSFMHYFKIDVCISMIVGAITFKINKTVALAIMRAIK